MWRALRNVRVSSPPCRPLAAQAQPFFGVRVASTLSKDMIAESTPIAKQLAETGVWTEKAKRKSTKKTTTAKSKATTKTKTTAKSKKIKAADAPRPTGDKSRVNIVSQRLCDDIVEYIGPSLKRHVGCDILDINPGAGVWSRTLHDTLQPRSHILMEPDAELYRPFIDPLLAKPGTRLVPHSGILWKELQAAMEHLEHQVEQPRSPSDEPKRNDTLLVTANLSFFPKRRYRHFDSIATLVLFQLLSSIRYNTLFQKYGLVRMLIWVNDDDKRTFLPRSLQNRKKSALEAEFACEWLAEVASKDPAALQVDPAQLRKIYLRDKGINLDSTRKALARAKANGMGMPPPHRRMELTEEVIQIESESTGPKDDTPDVKSSWVERPYMIELAELDRAHETGELAPGSKEAVRRAALRSQVNKQEKWTARFDELFKELAELTRLRVSGELSEAELAAREAAYNEDVQSLGKNPLIDFRLLRDNAHLYQQDPPVMLWDRRPWEPLKVADDEFYPNAGTALLDIQPKAMHKLLRECGPGSSRAGDMFDLMQRSMLSMSVDPIGTSLDRLWPGAREGILEHCPSLRDPTKGGMPGDGQAGINARVLNEEQWMEILQGFMAWPFRPSYSELIGRHGDDIEMDDAEGPSGGGGGGAADVL